MGVQGAGEAPRGITCIFCERVHVCVRTNEKVRVSWRVLPHQADKTKRGWLV